MESSLPWSLLTSSEPDAQHHICLGSSAGPPTTPLKELLCKGLQATGLGLSSEEQLARLHCKYYYSKTSSSLSQKEPDFLWDGWVNSSFKGSCGRAGSALRLESKDSSLRSNAKHFVNVQVCMSSWIISVIVFLKQTHSKPGSWARASSALQGGRHFSTENSTPTL